MSKRKHTQLEPYSHAHAANIVDEYDHYDRGVHLSPYSQSRMLLFLFGILGLALVISAIVLMITNKPLITAIAFVIIASFAILLVSKVAEKAHGSWWSIHERNRQSKRNQQLDEEEIKAVRLENAQKFAELQRFVHTIPIELNSSVFVSPVYDGWNQISNHARVALLDQGQGNGSQPLQPQWSKPAKYDVDTVLDHYRYGTVFLGKNMSDNYRTQPIEKAFHILICGSTSNGKTNLLRNLLMTMADYADCYFVHPMFANVGFVKDHRKIEVWEPILKRLKNNPEELKGQPKKIESLFSSFTNLLDIRSREKGTAKEMSWRPMYLFVDEGPNIAKYIVNAIETFGRIVREGRQLEIYLVLTAQSIQVQALGIPTSDLTNFKTMFYLGGDEVSRRYMLGSEKKRGKDLGSDESIEELLNGGTMLVRAEGMSSSELLQTPLMTNTGIATYFGEEFNESYYREWLNAWEEKFGSRRFERVGNVTVTEINHQFPETPDGTQSTVQSTFAFSENSNYMSPEAYSEQSGFPETEDQNRQSYVVQPKPIPITDHEIRTVTSAYHLLRNQNQSITANALIKAARTLVSEKEASEWHNSKSEIVKAICEQEKIPLQRGIGGRTATSKV